MLAYALFFAFVSAFVVIAAVGHFLLLAATYPDWFGNAGAPAENAVETGRPSLEGPADPPAIQPTSKLAA